MSFKDDKGLPSHAIFDYKTLLLFDQGTSANENHHVYVVDTRLYGVIMELMYEFVTVPM